MRITSVRFSRFKAFNNYSVAFSDFNVLVGPNNAGKSTIICAFRILSEALRKANSKNPSLIEFGEGRVKGYEVNLRNVPMASENIFHDYDDSIGARISFRLSNGDQFVLHFPHQGLCFLTIVSANKPALTAGAFRQKYPIVIGFTPILGPVEHKEPVYQKEAARLALYSHSASRNFRNIWHHYPDKFEDFKRLIQETWPGMDVDCPEVDYSHESPVLHMFCPEDRIPREIFWAGFGFQIWCQMLTHIVNNTDATIFLIDEPDIYLHSELQHQLVSILRSLGPDVIIATHSTEIISSVEPNEILIIDKNKQSAERIKSSAKLVSLFDVLGSSLNPTLTQLTRTRRAVFVEGNDFKVISQFADKLGKRNVSLRSDFAIVKTNGFNPNTVQVFTEGIEATIDSEIKTAVIFDKDYRCDEEVAIIKNRLQEHCSCVVVHERKELENFLLIPEAIQRLYDKHFAKMRNESAEEREYIKSILEDVMEECKHDTQAQLIEKKKLFMRKSGSSFDDATITALLLKQFDEEWSDFDSRLLMVPGKQVLTRLRGRVQEELGVTLTNSAIINEISIEEIPNEMINLVNDLEFFSSSET